MLPLTQQLWKHEVGSCPAPRLWETAVSNEGQRREVWGWENGKKSKMCLHEAALTSAQLVFPPVTSVLP